MDPISLLASSLGRNDEEPNIELARAIAANGDAGAVLALVDALADRNKGIRSDAIKTLYEVGAIRPDLVEPFAMTFVDLLSSRDNRQVWGAMSALETLVDLASETIVRALPTLRAAAIGGSVITNDRYTSILAKLNRCPGHREVAFPLLIEQLQRAPTNQLPMYAELAVGSAAPDQRVAFTTLLTARLSEVPQGAKRRRIAKALDALGTIAEVH